MDFSDWTFTDDSENPVRKIQERAAQDVLEILYEPESIHVCLDTRRDTKNQPPVISVSVFEDFEKPIEFDLKDVFYFFDVSQDIYTPDQLRYLAEFFEDFAAKCRAAASPSQTP